MNYPPDQIVTVSILTRVLDDRFGAFESKMMEGFEALERKIDIVDTSSMERHEALLKKIEAVGKESEQRDKLLSAQIMHLTITKMDKED